LDFLLLSMNTISSLLLRLREALKSCELNVELFDNILHYFITKLSVDLRKKIYGDRSTGTPPSGVKRIRGRQILRC